MDFQTPLEMEAASSRNTNDGVEGPYVPSFPMQRGDASHVDDAHAMPGFDGVAAHQATERRKMTQLVSSQHLNDEYERLSVAVRANVTPGFPFALNRSAYDESHNLDAVDDRLLKVDAKHRRKRDKVNDWRDVFLMYENMRKRVIRDNQLLQQRQGKSVR